MSAAAKVSVGAVGQTAYVRVEGKGSFESSAGLKDFFKEMLRRGYQEFVVDLGPCDMMDSTFMGTLAGAALRLREAGRGRLLAMNANIRNRELLAGLGLDHLFDVAKSAAPGPAKLSAVTPVAGEERKAAVLEAHEALAEVDAANAVRFHDVIEFLKREKAGTEDGVR